LIKLTKKQEKPPKILRNLKQNKKKEKNSRKKNLTN